MRRSAKLAALIGAVAVLGTAHAATMADMVRARVAAYRELGAAFKAVNDGLRGAPQTVLIQQSARTIRNVSRQQYGWFPAGSGAQAGVKTAAKAEIWARPAQFKAAQDNFAKQADAFQRAAATGDAAAIRAEARKLGATCKACHDVFRAPIT